MESLASYVVTGVVSLAVGIALRGLEPKVKIVWWSPHSFLFDIPKPIAVLFTHTITIQNVGRKAAEFVEIVHKRRPDYFKLQPPLDYGEATTASGEHVVRIKTLGPKEFFTIEFLSYANLPELQYIRSEAGHAQPIQIQPQQVFPKWFQWLSVALIVVGFGSVLFWLLRAVFFVLKGNRAFSP